MKLVWSKHITESNYWGEVLGPRDGSQEAGEEAPWLARVSGCLTPERAFLTLAG